MHGSGAEIGKRLDPEAERLLRDYRNRLERALERHRLREPERREIQREIESHLCERLRRVAADPVEPSQVLDILYKLGEPESYVPLYLTQSDLARGLRGSPRHLLRGYGRWLRATATQYVLSLPFVLCYLLSLLLILVGLAKLIFPENFHVYAYTSAATATAAAAPAPASAVETGGERAYLSLRVSFAAPDVNEYEYEGEGKGEGEGTSARRVELLSPLGAGGLVVVGWGIALLATGLLRRLLRGLLLRQYGI